MKYAVKYTSQFKKDIKLAQKQNKKTEKLFDVISVLAEGKQLDTKYRDHSLSGIYKGTRECHIEPDWLLIYEIINKVLVLVLYRTGSHSELFKK
ncbi:MAG: type II toxin-antitoxin system YafQ family toxin [Elusimicrobiales bacterium]|nr:type II toxin-antitoxin system YafQ family toxin [Elusimicrobiales bacterium]